MAIISAKELGARLAKHRQRVGLSQAKAAEQAELSDETVSRVERGAQGISIDALGALAETYGTNLSDLLQDDDASARDPRGVVIARVVALLRKQTADEIEIAANLLQTLFRDLTARRKPRRRG